MPENNSKNATTNPIRYSGDLELRLSFAESPEKRTSFKGFDKIFLEISKKSFSEPRSSLTVNDPEKVSFKNSSYQTTTENNNTDTLVKLGYREFKTVGGREIPENLNSKKNFTQDFYLPSHVVLEKEKNFFLQSRSLVYLTIFITSLISFIVTLKESKNFGNNINQEKVLFLQNESLKQSFFSSLNGLMFFEIFTVIFSLIYLTFYFLVSPSTNSTIYSFTVSEKKVSALSDIIGHTILSIIKTILIFKTLSYLNFTNSQYSIIVGMIFGLFSSVFIATASIVKFREGKKSFIY
ncbi:hypothetical protein HDU92_001427 [Lobulomyces angularis]|nr:hypothetical protein HDU92_001427 [Lobulomyces angularis]